MPKHSAPLSAVKLANTKPGEKPIELIDGAVPGLRVRIHPSGLQSWSLNIRDHAGVRRRFDVGASLGLAEARRKAEAIKQMVRAGQDPTSARRNARTQAKAAAQGIGTFEALVRTYFNGNSAPGAALKSKAEQERRIKVVFSAFLKRSASSLTESELQLAADAHKATVSAARAVGYLNPILKWAFKRDLISGRFLLEKPAAQADEIEGQRVLSIEEVRTLLPYLSDAHGAAACMMLMTAARREEVAAATWAEFDLQAATWTIAAGRRKDTRSKTRRKQAPAAPHVIPLARQALELLQDVREREIKRRSVLKDQVALANSDLTFPGERGAKLQNWNRWTKRVSKAAEVTGWSPHALRRTAATLAADLGAEPHIISVILGHKNIGGQLTAIYSKSRYTKQHAEALQKLADFINK